VARRCCSRAGDEGGSPRFADVAAVAAGFADLAPAAPGFADLAAVPVE
jgi:hypothetical protein